MNRISIFLFLSLVCFIIIQLGAQLFAITVVVSTLVESPPESFAMVQVDYPYDSSKFWDIYPNILGGLFLITIFFNWKTRFKNWVLISFGINILSGIFAIFVLEPAQNNVLNSTINELGSNTLQDDALIWYSYDWILCSLTLLTAIPLLIPIFKELKSSNNQS